jgi:hypothetical protein
MSFRKFIILMLISTFLSILSWLALVFLTAPTVNPWQMILFYPSLFLSLVGLIFLVNLALRIRFSQETFYFNYIQITFRQAILFSVLLVSCLFLQERRLLTWWNVLFLIGAIALLELFALSRRKKI